MEEARRRRRLAAGIGKSLRELAIQLSLLNHQIGAKLELQDVDIDCLDLIDRHIDFFGDGALGDGACDRCGDLFLESLA